MSLKDPNISEGTAIVFTWLADKVLGGAKKALSWGWDRGQWIAAQDRYDAQIIKQHGEIRIFGQVTPRPLKDIFCDVYVLDKPTAWRRFSPEALREHLWSEDRSLPFRQSEREPGEQLLDRGTKFLILGKPGAGKTTFLKRLAVREAQRGKWGPCLGKIPIFVSLKQFSESQKTLFDFIADQFSVCHFPDAAPFLEKLLKSGKALVLFDGLDEVPNAADVEQDQRGRVTTLLEEFAHQYDDCHVVITCRIAATEYSFDPAFTYLEMADFAPDQVEAFVRNWFWDSAEPDRGANLAEQMLAEWEKAEHAGIRDLTRNPLLLTLLCLNYEETLSFPARRVEIYEEALHTLLKKWDSSRQIRRHSLYKTLSPGRKEQMFSCIAYDTFAQNEILFAQADLEKRLKDYLIHVPEMPQAIDIDAEAILQEIVAQHGIFVVQAHRLYSFAHLTFQEYYVARHIAQNLTPDAVERLMGHITDNRWREVFLLTASMLPDATSLLAAFEKVMNRLIALHPGVLGWLRWIDEQAGASQAGYRRASTRAYYSYALTSALTRLARRAIVDLAHTQASDPNRLLAVTRLSSLDFSRTLAGALALVLDRNLVRDLYLDLVSDPDLVNDRVRTHDLVLALDRSLARAHARDRDRDHARARDLYRDRDLDLLQRYRQLQSEAETLSSDRWGRWQPKQEELEAISEYMRLSYLLYACLQLAYVSDRHSFEDRMFLPSPPL